MNSLPFAPSSKIFLYLRDSGHEEQDLSIDQQESAARRWASENGLIISHIYKDEARKGSSTVGRTSLHAMMHEFRRGTEARGVVVWRYNRFARSVDNAQFYRAEIRTRGYIFFSLNDKVPEGPMGRLIEAAIDFKDEQYLIDLSEDVRRGLRDLVEKYGCVPGQPPIGILRERVLIGTRRDGTPHIAHRWLPDPDLAPRILKAFQMRAAHISLGNIHKETRILGSINSYRTLYSNPIYKGMLQFGDLTIPDYCEPIVPSALWDSVQAIQNHYAHRRHVQADSPDHPRRAKSKFLLSGLARHAICGSPLYGHSSIHKSGRYYGSYFCARAYRKRDCDKKRIPQDVFEKAVIQSIDDYVLNPDFLTAACDELSHAQADRLTNQKKQRRILTLGLARLRKQIHNLIDSLADLGHSKAITEKLKDLETQETDLTSHLIQLDTSAEINIPKLPPEILQAISKNFHENFDHADLETKRAILRAYIDHVDVERDGAILRILIHFYYPVAPDNVVPTSSFPSGPPQYRHILQRAFIVPIKHPRQ